MKKKITGSVGSILFTVIILVSVAIFYGCSGIKSYDGYKILESRFVDEVNAECVYLEHEKSGAKVFKIMADDPNKLFAIAFKTLPGSDCGTPHIIEHSVLNGSENFPVKSPFDVLMRGSLNTFLNAMTGSHMTMYPVASMNDKDYFNLMHVYLDAVFNPLIYDDPRIFKQEGWHYELTGEDQPMVYKGVVYNEMKGAYSSPNRELSYQVYRNLFPDNCYRYSSGGYPTAIPELSYEDFLAFHEKHYHPTNSYILLYGDADLSEELKFIDENYLSNYERSEKVVEIKEQSPFDQMKRIVRTYPVMENTDTGDKTFLQLSFVVGHLTDYAHTMAWDVLADVLVNQESAPLRKALQEEGIGSDVSAYLDNNKQTALHIIVRNANEEDRDSFYEITMDVLEKASQEGIDKKSLEGTLNRMEFRLREGDSPQKGLIYGMQLLGGWFFKGDPYAGLEYEEPLAEVKKALTEDYMEQLIKDDLLSNNHSLLIALKPELGLQKEINAEVNEELAAAKEAMNREELSALVKETNELIEYQNREDTKEALQSIPMLALEDIENDVKWYEAGEKDVKGVKTIHLDEFSNGIMYNKLLFDLRALPLEKIKYASLLSNLLGKFNTENYSYGELDNELNIHTGGFSSSTTIYNEGFNDKNVIPKLVISSKALKDKTAKMFELMAEIINKSDYADRERLKELLTRHYARVDAGVRNNGMSYAAMRNFSYYSHSGMCNELMSGLEYYWFLADLVKNFDNKADDIIAGLQEASDMLFQSSNMLAAITCSENDYKIYSDTLGDFIATLPGDQTELLAWNIEPVKKNEAFKTTSKVQYVVKGANFKDLGYDWSGKMRVLNQVLSTDWLQNQIRVIGGAYGGFANFSKSGNVYFGSYRDPNLAESLEVYDKTPEFLDGFEADKEAMTRFIIGTISDLDYPETASMKGNTALSRYFSGLTMEALQQERNEVLNTSVEDISAMSDMIKDIMEQDIYCVYGNNEKIEDNSDLFMTVLDPVK
ncbi:MAG: insulinase family protein [Bacteroidales bacterium]|nr:insulinase family protein [Bacteroidales bacterium]